MVAKILRTTVFQKEISSEFHIGEQNRVDYLRLESLGFGAFDELVADLTGIVSRNKN